MTDLDTMQETQAKMIIEQATKTLHERRQALGTLDIHEVDFFVGVMAAMQALGLWSRVPGYWHMNIISGRPIVAYEPPEMEPTTRQKISHLERELASLREQLEFED